MLKLASVFFSSVRIDAQALPQLHWGAEVQQKFRTLTPSDVAFNEEKVLLFLRFVAFKVPFLLFNFAFLVFVLNSTERVFQRHFTQRDFRLRRKKKKKVVQVSSFEASCLESWLVFLDFSFFCRCKWNIRCMRYRWKQLFTKNKKINNFLNLIFYLVWMYTLFFWKQCIFELAIFSQTHSFMVCYDKVNLD